MEVATRNEVVLVGRLSAMPEDRELPSGDLLRTWRLVMDRPVPRRKLPEGVRPATIDTVDCFAWAPAVQKAAAGWTVGDVIAVEGSLRRRFWQIPTGVTSKTEVEVSKAKRVARAP